MAVGALRELIEEVSQNSNNNKKYRYIYIYIYIYILVSFIRRITKKILFFFLFFHARPCLH